MLNPKDGNERGRHIGKELFEAVKIKAVELKAYHITLRVWELNKEAILFYRSMGMQPLFTEMEFMI